MDKPIVNRVANSGLITLNLEEYYPKQAIETLDLKDYLFMELILKEKDFRQSMKDHDWEQYSGKVLLVDCSADAIIPLWAYMLVAVYARPFASDIYNGNLEGFLNDHYRTAIRSINEDQYVDQRLVIKGCGNKPVPAGAYLELTAHLQPVAKSIMFGEPCSTVPIYKKRK